MSQVVQLLWQRPPLTQNIVRRMHHYTEAKAKRIALAEAVVSIRRAKVTPMDRAIITLHYRPATWRVWDCDGLAVTHKVVQDALVAAGVLPKDDFRHVPEIRIKAHDPERGKPGALWLELEAVA